MKKLWFNIKLFFHSLAWGMKSADAIISESNKDMEGGDPAGIEQHKETKSVYDDLLRGEVTQEVKELRHEMYYAERKSHEYEYGGNGRAVKRNSMFDYKGNVEQDDNYEIKIVQENHEDPSSLIDMGIYCMGEKFELDDKAKEDLRLKNKRDFTIEIERDFIPSFRLEQYATKLVVKKIDEAHVMLDVYVPAYSKQFDNNSKMFLKAIEKIYKGERRSDIVDFSKLGFISYNAYGTDDLKKYLYKNIILSNVVKFDGSYVLKFCAVPEINGEDLISEFYDKTADEKSKNHEMREGATLNIENVVESQEIDNYDVKQAMAVAEELANEQ